MTLLLIFIFGLFVGSFLNVLVERIPKGESFIAERSHCDFCGHTLAWFDLIPLFSFVALQGKCRYCHKKLSMQYPIMELLTGILFVLTFLFIATNFQTGSVILGSPDSIGTTPESLNGKRSWTSQDDGTRLLNIQFLFHLIFYLYIIASLIVIFFIDFKYGIIPFSIIFPAIGIIVLFLILDLPAGRQDSLFFIHVLSGLGAFLFFLMLFLITKGRGIGFGDVVYVLFMGLLLGFPGIIIGLYIAFLTGAAISPILVLAKKKRLKGGTIPFGPFLVFGTIIALFWGESISRFVKAFFYG